MRAERAFHEVLRAALLGTVALGIPLLITLFPGAFERTLHGYDAITEACVAAMYQLGSQLPPLGSLVLGLAAAALSAAGLKVARTMVRTRDALRSRVPIPLPTRVLEAAQRVGIDGYTRCSADARPLAFCAGLLRPQVWISTGAVARLRDDELEAVLRHEGYHARHRDPLRILVVRVLAGTFFLFPLVGARAQRFELAKELDADVDVLRAQGGAGPLAGALQALSATALPVRGGDIAVGAWSSTHARVKQLCGDPEPVLPRTVSSRASLLTAFGLAATLILTGGQAARANLLPAVVVQSITGAAVIDIHQCPLPIDGVLF